MSGENKLPDSESMKKTLTHWIGELHRHAPDTIGDILRFQLAECNAEAGEYSFLVETEPWMRNAFGSLHGGIIATMLDQGMGMLSTCLTGGEKLTPSVQLNIAFQRPMVAGKQVLLKVYVESMTRMLIHMRGEAFQDKLCATGAGIFFVKPSDEENR